MDRAGRLASEGMSALPPEADIAQREWRVPEAERFGFEGAAANTLNVR